MNRAAFFASVRSRTSGVFGGSLSSTQVQGTEAILDEAERRGTPLAHLAYILATAFHETAHTMQPIAEYGKGKGRKYGVKGKYGQVPYVRGYVQLTWDSNYENADEKLGLDGALLRNFDLAMKPHIASQIMFQGMEEGWFTGKKLADYIGGGKKDYVGSRRIINGNDRASMIAGYAERFETALVSAGYDGKPGPAPVPIPMPRPTPAPPAAREDTIGKTDPVPSRPIAPGTAAAAGGIIALLAAAAAAVSGWFDNLFQGWF